MGATEYIGSGFPGPDAIRTGAGRRTGGWAPRWLGGVPRGSRAPAVCSHAMRAGDVAAFPKGDGNGHVLHNRSDAPCCFVAIGKPAASDCHYPDIDMHLTEGRGFHRKNGSDF